MDKLVDENGLSLEEFLANYKEKDYPKPSMTADVVIFTLENKKLSVLLIERKGHPCLGKWAFPGGFSNKGETIDETAARELEEETCIKGLPLEQLRVFSTPNRDPRTWVMTTAFVTLIKNKVKAKASDDANNVAYFEISYKKSAENLEISLMGPKLLRASLKIAKKQGINKVYSEYQQITSDLAFDHAEILAYALEKVLE